MCRILISTIVMLCLTFGTICAGQSPSINHYLIPYKDSLTTNVPLNEISTRAYRDFLKKYGSVASATWFRQSNGFTVKFYSPDSTLHVIHYSLRGRLADTWVYYSGNNAPPAVRSNMDALYVGYTILFVNEFENIDRPVYQVGLVHGEEFRLVEIKDEETKTIQFFTGYVAQR